ncbi:MAG: LysR family transcriptional regulator [Pseudomonadota bacterium]|nr:LysR family transcriptional regulator [Pseudomonadota bacterium]
MLQPAWLKTFKSLVEIGHFTKTAESLNMTQPGVSQHVAKLEEHCGYPLIKRFKKSFEVTLYGQKVYRYACQYFTREDLLLQSLGVDELYSGKCTLGCSGTLAWQLYGHLLKLQAQYQDLSICVEAAPNRRVLQAIQDGILDMGLVTSEPSTKHFETKVVGVESIVFVVPVNTPNISLQQLVTEFKAVDHPDLKHYFELCCRHINVDELGAYRYEDIPKVTYINQIHQILLPVAQGLGYTIIPQGCVELFENKDQLRVLSLEDTIQETIHLVQKKNTQIGRRYDMLINAISAVLNAQTKL